MSTQSVATLNKDLETGAAPSGATRRSAASPAPLPDPQCSLETLGSRRLHCGIWNADAKPGQTPLVVFNGIGMNLETLQPLVETLTQTLGKRPILALDAPGIGASPDPLVPYTPGMVAGWMAEWLDQKGYGQVDVLGYSWGGAIAQEMALRFKPRVRRMALAAIGPGWPVIPGNPATLLHLADPRWIPSLLQDPRRAGFYGLGPSDRAALTPDFLGRLKPPGTLGYLYQMMALAGWSSTLSLPLLDRPSLVLMGAKDTIVPPANGRLLARLIPDAQLEVIAGAGHLLIFSHMRQCVQALQSFLA